MPLALSRSDDQHLSAIFQALSEPLRLDIIRRIDEVEELPCTVLEEELPISKSTISYHMKLLYNAGLIDIRKDGRYYHYRLRRDLLAYYMHRFLQDITSTKVVVREEQAAPKVRQRIRSKPTSTKSARSGQSSRARKKAS